MWSRAHRLNAGSANRGGDRAAACDSSGRLSRPRLPQPRQVAVLRSPRRCPLAARRTRLHAFGGEDSLVFLDNGECIAMPKKRAIVGPSYDLDKEGALRVQMEALQRNNVPFPDHGIEVMYRFANFSPFERTNYFGRSLDLGQFERFRRVMHSPYYAPLLEHSSYEVLASLEVSDGQWRARVKVYDTHQLEDQTYSIALTQRLGGHYDGYWFTESLVCEGQEWRKVLAFGI